MNSKKNDIGSKDLISNLPESLISHILSFLSTNEAALTSILSKRWRFSMALVPNLDFDSSVPIIRNTGRRKCHMMSPSFKAFVEKTMFLQGDVSLNKFSLRCKIRNDRARVESWISNVLDRGVLDLDLYICSDGDFPVPSKILMSSTLVRLKLGGCGEKFNIDDIEDIYLPKLKYLYLVDDIVYEETCVNVTKLLSGCPVLEELFIINTVWRLSKFCSLSHKSLKRVTIHDDIFDENPESVSFDTPNLVYLEFSYVVAIEYPKMNFDSLVEARLDLQLTCFQKEMAEYPVDGMEDEMDGDAAGFLTGIRTVKILCLSPDTLEVLTFCCTAIPVFNNLIHLTIETNRSVGWYSLPKLLGNCPNLETLVFKGLHYKVTNQCEDESYRFNDKNACCDKYKEKCVFKPWGGVPICLSTSPVKTLKVLEFGKITLYKDELDRQVDLIKLFVEAMPNLEQVILYWDTPFDDDDVDIQLIEFRILKKVASSKCKIEIVFEDAIVSSYRLERFNKAASVIVLALTTIVAM